jgi:two-component system cell cycle sensor histidine kinase/response regulator CckA
VAAPENFATLALLSASLATVLVVDDDPRMRDLLTSLLRFSKYEAISAASPAQALAALQDRPDIALTIADIVMPGMNGYDLAEEIRRIRPDMRLVFMSGFAADPLRRAVDAPCLAKPFTAAELISAIDEALKGLR